MKRGRKQFTLGSLMVLVALCAVAFAFPELSRGVLVLALLACSFLLANFGFAFAALIAPLYFLDYMDRRHDARAERKGPRLKASDSEKPLVANLIDPSTGQVM
jgi:hypothetical protein